MGGDTAMGRVGAVEDPATHADGMLPDGSGVYVTRLVDGKGLAARRPPPSGACPRSGRLCHRRRAHG